MKGEKYFEYIKKQLYEYVLKLECDAKFNLLNEHIYAEHFFKRLFNILYDYELENVNKYKSNVEAIDLIDENKKIIIQVSAQQRNIKEKIKESLTKLSMEHYKGYNYKFISITRNASNEVRKSYDIPHELKFNPNEDILDIEKILHKIDGHPKIEKVYEYITWEFEQGYKFYADLKHFAEPQNYQAIKKILKENHCLILGGEPGVGKTTTATKLIYEILEEEYIFNVVEERDVHTLSKKVRTTEEFIFYLEDPWGKFSGRDSCADNLEKLRDVLHDFLNNKYNKKYLIITTRDTVLKEKDSDILNVFEIIYQMISARDYTKKEKKKILEHYEFDYHQEKFLKEYTDKLLNEDLNPFCLSRFARFLKEETKYPICYDDLLNKCRIEKECFLKEFDKRTREEQKAGIALGLLFNSLNVVTKKDIGVLYKIMHKEVDFDAAIGSWLKKYGWVTKDTSYKNKNASYRTHPIALEGLQECIEDNNFFVQENYNSWLKELLKHDGFFDKVKFIKSISHMIDIEDDVQETINCKLIDLLVDSDGDDFTKYFEHNVIWLKGNNVLIKMIKWLLNGGREYSYQKGTILRAQDVLFIWKENYWEESELEELRNDPRAKKIAEKYLKNVFFFPGILGMDSGKNLFKIFSRIEWDFSEVFSEIDQSDFDFDEERFRMARSYGKGIGDSIDEVIAKLVSLDEIWKKECEEDYLKVEQLEDCDDKIDYEQIIDESDNLYGELEYFIKIRVEQEGYDWIIEYIIDKEKSRYFIEILKDRILEVSDSRKQELLNELEKIMLCDSSHISRMAFEVMINYYSLDLNSILCFLEKIYQKYNNVEALDVIYYAVEKLYPNKNKESKAFDWLEKMTFIKNEERTSIMKCVLNMNNVESNGDVAGISDSEKKVLISILKTSKSEMKVNAMEILMKSNSLDEGLAREWIETEGHYDFREKLYRVAFMHSSNPSNINILKIGLKDKDYRNRIVCLESLLEYDLSSNLYLLRELSRDKSAYVRKKVVDLIKKYKVRDMEDVLFELVEDDYEVDNETISSGAAETLFELKYEYSSDEFIDLCWQFIKEKKSDELRESAIIELINCYIKYNKKLDDKRLEFLKQEVYQVENEFAKCAIVYICLIEKANEEFIDIISKNEERLLIAFLFFEIGDLKEIIKSNIHNIENHPIYLLYQKKRKLGSINEENWKKINEEIKHIGKIIKEQERAMIICFQFIFGEEERKIMGLAY